VVCHFRHDLFGRNWVGWPSRNFWGDKEAPMSISHWGIFPGFYTTGYYGGAACCPAIWYPASWDWLFE
jgi:hypothetical protein